ncbi:DUF2892 domain-containing protein [[Empedobacter] haloabium]|uniref:DUF2892 domain-containing protein n=1 Tax=[Empedobacter] haloabium TaxID=592317 RepID=A0ABZ1UMM6_9BURK
MRNLTGKESAVRAIGGIMLVAGAVVAWYQGETTAGLGLVAAGLGAMLSGLFGYCPACALAGRCGLRKRGG